MPDLQNACVAIYAQAMKVLAVIFLISPHQFSPVKKAIVSVINDLVTDQRVHKTCTTLHEMGFDVLLVGREKRDSPPLAPRAYRTHRMKLMFEKGVLFYATFQWRLFWFLLFRKADVYVANDLDTLWPNRILARWRNKMIVYDAHEIFTEVPELTNRPTKQKLWKRLERHLVPGLKNMFTVNASIAAWYKERYNVNPYVLRNMPRLHVSPVCMKTREALGLPTDRKIVLLQGAGINVDRGAEEAVAAMEFLPEAILLIIGSGDVIATLKRNVAEKKLEDRVRFIARLPLEELRIYTRLADVGLTLDKDTNINYRFSLPNKIFDYIHAGVPVLASDLIEVKRIVETYAIGAIAPSHDPKTIAQTLRAMFDESKQQHWRAQAEKVKHELCWEAEEVNLKQVFAPLLKAK